MRVCVYDTYTNLNTLSYFNQTWYTFNFKNMRKRQILRSINVFRGRWELTTEVISV